MSNRIEIGYGIALNFTTKNGSTVPTDVWIQFRGEDGKSSAISIAAEAERIGPIGDGLRSWASDRIHEHIAAQIAEVMRMRNAKQEGTGQ